MDSIVYHNPDHIHRYNLIIPHSDPADFRVLIYKKDNRWALPTFHPQEHHFAIVDHINHHVAKELRLYAATLRCIHTETDPVAKIEDRFYALDNVHTQWEAPDQMRWATEDQIRLIDMVSDAQKDILLTWFDWAHSDSSMRVPWMRRGWFSTVANWVVDLADRMALEDIGRAEQIRSWARSSTVRVKTADGALYFKAVAEAFSYEPVITRVLSIRYPGYAPDVRAVHVDNGWMLTRDFGGKTLTDVPDIAVWEKAIRRYAEMQLDLTRSTQSLVGLGVPDRNVDYMASQVERLLNQLPDGLTEEEQRQLKRMGSSLRNLCFDLVEHRVPLSLTHGDLWSGNIIIRGEDQSSMVFDWSDASVSHPFFDIPPLLAEIEQELPDVPDARERLRDAYLDVWTRYEPMANLRRAYNIAQVLAYLHRALFYHSYLLPRIESNSRWELQHRLPMMLRHVIEESKKLRPS